MISAIIIEDELHCSERLMRLLQLHCPDKVEILGVFDHPQAGRNAIETLHPGVVFLDVQLQGSTAFDLLRQLPVIDFQLIFTTAYEHYAVEAFRFSALDYLLKPIDASLLQQAVAKLKDGPAGVSLRQQLAVLYSYVHPGKSQPETICIPTMEGLEFVRIDELIRCQADVNYTRLFLKGQQPFLVSKTLKEYQSMLEPHGFFRVHQSHLVNLNYVKKYHKGTGGYITLSDGSEIEVSTRRKEAFLQRMSGF